MRLGGEASLANSADLRESIVQAGRLRVSESPDNWERKVDRMREIDAATIVRKSSKCPWSEVAAPPLASSR
jgi:hypothetical protein